MIPKYLIAIVALVSFLSGCSNADNNASSSSGGEVIGLSKYASSTPALLRAIPSSDLSMELSVGNVTEAYNGEFFPDGRWLISVDIQPNQTHDISIKWFMADHLLLEETGQFYADPSQPTIAPELDFVSAGYPRFDDDCDGYSNLDELRLGSNLTFDEDPGKWSTCEQLPESELMAEEYPWIIRQQKLFRSNNFEQRVTSYEQSIRVTSVNPDLRSTYNTLMLTDTALGEAIRANIGFVYNAEFGKLINFQISRASGAEAPVIEGTNCGPNGPDDLGYSCTAPFDWQENRWYNIRFEELSDNSWQGSIREASSELSQVIAIINTESSIDWYRPQSGLTYNTPISASDCAMGIPPISVQFTPGVVNNVQRLEGLQIVASDCVKAGAGWQGGAKNTDDELVYSLTIGKSE